MTAERTRNAKVALASGKYTFSSAEHQIHSADGGFHCELNFVDVSKVKS